MKKLLMVAAALLAISSSIHAQAPSGTFHNERLKTLVLPGPPLVKTKSYSYSAVAGGIWLSDSSDPKKALVLPQQVKILCSRSAKQCTEISVTLGPVPTLVGIEDVDNTVYEVDKWDDHGLTASYGGDESSRCQRHVLTVDFDSGAVSVADIPTHKTGCDAFKETDSYKLVRGQYYVDTTPGNDLDKKGTNR
ncbi:MAG: hypothetical protein WBR26_09115 [Candidatus Acidiferrum sp.]